MTQEVDSELWKEFEKEFNSIKTKSVNLQSSKIISKSLKEFWNKFLTDKFPEGKINEVLEKNLAIWICQNEIDIESIKQKYKEQKWEVGGLLGWVKKVQSNEITNLNIKELLQWSNENGKFEVETLENAKFELETSSNFKVLKENELDNYKTRECFWLIKNLLGSGKITILGGKRSTLKTWFALSGVYCIANEKPFLDTFETKKTNILVLDRENGWDELKKRRAMIKKGLGIEKDSNIFFLSESSMKLDEGSHLDYLEELIKSKEIGLIVCDTYRRLISFDEDNANAVSFFFIDLIKPICERTGCSFLFIAHEKKGESSGDDMDMLRGSSDFPNTVDGVIQLTKKGNRLIVKQTKNRGMKELEPFQVEIETDTTSYFKFNYVGEQQYKQDIIAQILTNWFIDQNIKSFTYTQGLKFIKSKGYAKNNFVEALRFLEQNNLVSKKEGNFRSPYIVSEEIVRERGVIK